MKAATITWVTALAGLALESLDWATWTWVTVAAATLGAILATVATFALADWARQDKKGEGDGSLQ